MKILATLGDTHLGRRFKTGVPLHRLGDREALIRQQFRDELLREQPPVHVHLGDLFDKPVVSPDDVLFAAETYVEAAWKNPDTTFYVLLGNHDASKNSENRTSFDLFEAIVGVSNHNVVCVKTPLLHAGGKIGLCPYNVFGTAEDYLRQILDQGVPSVVLGHWDVSFGDENLIPTQLMQEAGITYAITGHDHLRRMERRHGVDIEVFGSMQPYSHAEDAEGRWYVTLTLAETLEQADQLGQLNVRVLLKEGEILPTDINCLSMIGKRLTTDEKIEVDTSDFEQFDMSSALAAAIPERIRDRVLAFFHQSRNA